VIEQKSADGIVAKRQNEHAGHGEGLNPNPELKDMTNLNLLSSRKKLI
jgi:hypothetical protein